MPKLRTTTRWAATAMAASLIGIILIAISVSAASFLPNTYDPTRPEISWTAGSPPTFYTLNPWRWPLFIAGTGLLLAGMVANIMLLRTPAPQCTSRPASRCRYAAYTTTQGNENPAPRCAGTYLPVAGYGNH